jgi:periplasmic protein TonB
MPIMSYKALLFCPDEKTARTVTQILAELEFSVEPVVEPFAAVKKLTSEHFDALVVDGDNQQNATLLFKTARNSGSNQNSLAVAIVEGQSGVAKAFQIGANLVLTKPINVEQSKGTLRVARGLLRKTETAKGPAAGTPAFGGGFGDAKPPRPANLPASLTTPPASASAGTTSLFEREEEPAPTPEPAEAALLDSMPEPALPKPRPAAATAPAGKSSPWQPISQPMAQPVANALKHANQAMAKSSAAASTVAEHGSSGRATSGAAAAVAPAKVSKEVIDDLTEDVPDSSAPVKASPATADTKNTGMIAALLVVAVAAAGYFAWNKMHPQTVASAPRVRTTPAPPTSVPTSVPVNAVPQIGPAIAPHNPIVNSPSTAHSTPAPVNITDTPAATAKKAVTNISISPNKPETFEPKQEPLVVSGGDVPKAHVNAPADVEPLPAPAIVASNSGDSAVTGLVDTPVSTPKPGAHTLKVSQGVSQGLLVKKVAPIYPQRALAIGVQGEVQVLATIGADGSVTAVKLLSGDTLLAKAAMDAVKQWKYKPYYLDDKPLEIQTQITVNFKLP